MTYNTPDIVVGRFPAGHGGVSACGRMAVFVGLLGRLALTLLSVRWSGSAVGCGLVPPHP